MANDGKMTTGKRWYEKAEFFISTISVIIAAVALGLSWQVATTEREINRVDARISNCTAVAGTYLQQATLYGWPEYNSVSGHFQRTVLDENNERNAATALAIARAAQLCRVSSENLTSCIEERVNGVPEHYVVDIGTDGKRYSNPVC